MVNVFYMLIPRPLVSVFPAFWVWGGVLCVGGGSAGNEDSAGLTFVQLKSVLYSFLRYCKYLTDTIHVAA